MTPLQLLWILYSVVCLATLFYLGWRKQTTAESKEQYTMKWLDLVKNLAPFILAAVPGVPAVLIPAIVHGITIAELIPGASGAAKKAAVIDLVSTGLQTANAVKPGTIDEAATVAAVSNGIDATVNAVNAVHSVTKTS